MPKVFSVDSKQPMKGAEFKHIRTSVLGLTQVQLKEVVFRGIDRISSWENDRADIPPIVAAHMRARAKMNKP